MTTSPELQHAATAAWSAMLYEACPIPAGMALDMVQDAGGGERACAVGALLEAGVKWLRKAGYARYESGTTPNPGVLTMQRVLAALSLSLSLSWLDKRLNSTKQM